MSRIIKSPFIQEKIEPKSLPIPPEKIFNNNVINEDKPSSSVTNTNQQENVDIPELKLENGEDDEHPVEEQSVEKTIPSLVQLFNDPEITTDRVTKLLMNLCVVYKESQNWGLSVPIKLEELICHNELDYTCLCAQRKISSLNNKSYMRMFVENIVKALPKNKGTPEVSDVVNSIYKPIIKKKK